MTIMKEQRTNRATDSPDLESDITPIRRRKLGQEVLDRLLVKIQSGTFPPGSNLPSERELMILFSVGRPAVREALQGLERMGLLSIIHGERARVLSLSAESVVARMSDIAVHLLSSSQGLLEHFKEARLLFATGMVRVAAERATQSDIEDLRKALQTQSAGRKDAEKFLRTEVKFHRAIAAISRNPIYVALAQGMIDWMGTFYVDLGQARSEDDKTAAEQAMTANLNRTRDFYRQAP